MSAAPQHTSITRLVLVRHGEASGNRELRYLGVTDAPLTERGQEQARQIAAALSPFAVSAVYSSPLQRAQFTAAAIGAALGLAIQPEPELREQDFGAWENHTRAEVLALDPETLAAWERSAEVAPTGGESLAQVRDRTIACVDRLAAQHPGETIALVSHVGPVKALICAALALPLAGAQRMWLDPASLCVLDWRITASGPSTGMLHIFNGIAHLDPPPRWLSAGLK
ncbi:MAG: hypothetical protein OJF49_004403 [Ktedonobacterales bacterium]|nr:MAG: hypothetical protein OJF49_004403 [Ktedonobacterales bacterium]